MTTILVIYKSACICNQPRFLSSFCGLGVGDKHPFCWLGVGDKHPFCGLGVGDKHPFQNIAGHIRTAPGCSRGNENHFIVLPLTTGPRIFYFPSDRSRQHTQRQSISMDTDTCCAYGWRQ